MLAPSTAPRRTPPSSNQKPELPSISDITLIAPADDYTWRFLGTGSMVQTADWGELSDTMSKLRIAGEDSIPKMRNTATPGHEGSPLETSSSTSLGSSPSDQNLVLPTHSRGSSADASNGRALHGSIDQNWSHGDQPTFPSLSARDQQDFQVDYNAQRQFPGNAFVQPRTNNGPANVPFRQPQATRGFNQQLQNLAPSPANFTYPIQALAAGNTQQLYDMIIPQDPTIARVQGQPFRAAHQHSASDPASIREAAALQQLLANNLQQFSPNMYPPTALGGPALSMFANQFYPQDTYTPNDIAAAQLMARQIQTQYTGTYAGTPASNSGLTSPASTVAQNPPSGNGPSANNRKLGLYKTELCRSWEEKGTCRYGNKCQFAHGEEELRKVPRHPKYKTEICRTFWVSGSCPYGKRCCFIHTEVPAGGGPGSEGTPPPTQPAGRDRSSSTNSDPNDTSGSSLLARISAKRNQDANSTGSINSTPPPPTITNGRPPMGSLRVDTSVLDPLASKQNKSAYPTLANGMLIQANVPAPIMTHGPVTAGPDFGRHASARLDIVGQRKHQSRPSDGSLSGMEPVTQSPVTAHNDSPPLGIPRTSSRASGHTRSGSAGNWNVSSRSNLRDYRTAGPDGKPSAPWLTDISSGSSRLQEQTWG